MGKSPPEHDGTASEVFRPSVNRVSARAKRISKCRLVNETSVYHNLLIDKGLEPWYAPCGGGNGTPSNSAVWRNRTPGAREGRLVQTEITNEAKRLLKTKQIVFLKSVKAKRSMKINELIL